MRKLIFFITIVSALVLIFSKIEIIHQNIYVNNVSEKISMIKEKIKLIFFFQVKEIKLKNVKNLDNEQIYKNLSFKVGEEYLFINLKKNLKNLLNINELESAKIVKKKNGIIEVLISEKEPFLFWLKKDKKIVIDKNGEVLNFKNANFTNLKLLSGENANKNINSFYKIIQKYPELENKIVKFDFIENYRWNIILNDKVKIMLPRRNFEKSLEILVKILKRDELNNKGYEYFDMRINNKILFK
ncbi:MAG: hypothetical protein CMM91_08935 [Rickettsiales bacterium]|nr:hypothetical protein [Rickettsiales bacterium]OUV53163.1 MAG: hypothetical protein CBC87_04650 [Rickettsiales bacterium TMED127]|tara:strand:+ start:15701 stop:16429 length:729 start_codon:yes stop_codon:yes gene_type:complete